MIPPTPQKTHTHIISTINVKTNTSIRLPDQKYYITTFQEGPWFAEDPKQSAKNRRAQYLQYLEMAGEELLIVCLEMTSRILF